MGACRKYHVSLSNGVSLQSRAQWRFVLWLRNFHDPILPFVGVRSRPYQHKRFNDIGQARSLLDEKDARALAIRFQEVTEVARHRPEIGSDKYPVLMRGEGQHLGIRDTLQTGLMGRKKIDCRLTAETPSDDRIVETGIRQETDHWSNLRRASASPRDGLMPHSLKLHLDFGIRWMGSGEGILFALACRNVIFHIFPISKIESDRPINLLEAQYRIMRPNGLGGLPALKFSYDVG